MRQGMVQDVTCTRRCLGLFAAAFLRMTFSSLPTGALTTPLERLAFACTVLT
jgi:hypothetical protein